MRQHIINNFKVKERNERTSGCMWRNAGRIGEASSWAENTEMWNRKLNNHRAKTRKKNKNKNVKYTRMVCGANGRKHAGMVRVCVRVSIRYRSHSSGSIFESRACLICLYEATVNGVQRQRQANNVCWCSASTEQHKQRERTTDKNNSNKSNIYSSYRNVTRCLLFMFIFIVVILFCSSCFFRRRRHHRSCSCYCLRSRNTATATTSAFIVIVTFTVDDSTSFWQFGCDALTLDTLRFKIVLAFGFSSFFCFFLAAAPPIHRA